MGSNKQNSERGTKSMTWKKALAFVGIILVLILAPIFIIQWIHPNWVTEAAITLLTVTGPAYLMSKLEWVVASISGIVATIGVAMNKIGNIKKTATTQVTTAQQQTSEATSNVSNLLTENQALLTDKTNLATENTTLQTQLENTAPRISELETQNRTLQTQYNELRDLIKVNGVQADPTDSRVIDANTPKVA